MVDKTIAYINEHDAVLQKVNKPLVIEEFGLPRDNFSFAMQSSVTYRNKYFEAVMQTLLKSKKKNLAVLLAWGYVAATTKTEKNY